MSAWSFDIALDRLAEAIRRSERANLDVEKSRERARLAQRDVIENERSAEIAAKQFEDARAEVVRAHHNAVNTAMNTVIGRGTPHATEAT